MTFRVELLEVAVDVEGEIVIGKETIQSIWLDVGIHARNLVIVLLLLLVLLPADGNDFSVVNGLSVRVALDLEADLNIMLF